MNVFSLQVHQLEEFSPLGCKNTLGKQLQCFLCASSSLGWMRSPTPAASSNFDRNQSNSDWKNFLLLVGVLYLRVGSENFNFRPIDKWNSKSELYYWLWRFCSTLIEISQSLVRKSLVRNFFLAMIGVLFSDSIRNSDIWWTEHS